MGRSLIVAIALTFMIATGGCYHATVVTGMPASGTTVEKNWAPGFLWGLVRDSHGKIYVAGSGGRIVCLDAKSGKRAWAIDFFKEFGVSQPRWGFSESVLIDGDKVLLTTHPS